MDAKLKQKHVVQLTDLAPNTMYYLQATSTDSAGNVASTVIGSFTTRTQPSTAGPTYTEEPTVTGTSPGRALIQ